MAIKANTVGQTIGLCRLAGSEGGRPQKTMVCHKVSMQKGRVR